MKPATHCLALGLLGAILVAPAAMAQSTVDQAKSEYEQRQTRIRCAAHPDQGCLTQPESENAKAQREFRERQERIRGCKFDPQGVCR